MTSILSTFKRDNISSDDGLIWIMCLFKLTVVVGFKTGSGHSMSLLTMTEWSNI